jgi:hypothetical protein
MSSQSSRTIDRYVCSDCFDDYAVKAFIEDNAVETRCTYCGRISDSPIAAHFSEVFQFILEGIETEWEDPAESMAYESREGGYQGASVYDWYDLITEQIEELFEINADVLNDILSEMAGEHAWCHKDPYGLLEEEALSISWRNFSRQVKYQTRYIFSQLSDTVDPMDIDLIPVPRMLNTLSQELSRLEDEVDVVLTVEQDTEIMRARIHNIWKRYLNGRQLGTVPAKEARFSDRMSPSGIPMFYGAFDSDTALLEVIDHKRFTPPWKVATIATFKTTKVLKLLDLSNLPQVPSLFDQRMNYLRYTIIFLHEFAYELSKPIIKDGTEHIEYVPTQVFTEYIRHLFRDRYGDSLNGIKYVSAKANQQSCCVLFVNNEQCCGSISNPSDGDVANPECVLLLQKAERKRVFKIRGANA